MSKKTVQFQASFYPISDDREILINSGAKITMAELRRFIREYGIRPADLFGTSKDIDSQHQFGNSKTITMGELKKVIEERKYKPSDLYDPEDLKGDPLVKMLKDQADQKRKEKELKEKENDASHIPDNPFIPDIESDYIPDDKKKPDSDDSGEADHIPD